MHTLCPLDHGFIAFLRLDIQRLLSYPLILLNPLLGKYHAVARLPLRAIFLECAVILQLECIGFGHLVSEEAVVAIFIHAGLAVLVGWVWLVARLLLGMSLLLLI